MVYAVFRISIVAATVFLAGCQLIGPGTISAGREQYNEIIQRTSKQQTLANIVRVYKHEPTFFMDVTEVDAVASFGGSLTGGATNIGANTGTSGSTLAGRVGSAGGTVQYSETPTIRYVPLLGQALVQQLVTPVSVEVLATLTDSDWGAAPVLNFSMSYLTPEYDKTFTALNTIIELDNDNVLQFSAAASDLTKEKPGGTGGNLGGATLNIQTTAPKSEAKDSLVIYLLPNSRHKMKTNEAKDRLLVLRRWATLLRLYAGTQSEPVGEPDQTKSPPCDYSKSENWDDVEIYLTKLGNFSQSDDDVKRALRCLPNSIELRNAAVPLKNATQAKKNISDELRNAIANEDKATSAQPKAIPELQQAAAELKAAGADLAKISINPIMFAPTMKTQSALGILKTATEKPYPLIEFVTQEAYRHIREHLWNKKNIDTLDFYTLLPADEDSFGCPADPSGKASDQKAIGCDYPEKGNNWETKRAGAIAVKDLSEAECGDNALVSGLMDYAIDPTNPTSVRIAKWITVSACNNHKDSEGSTPMNARSPRTESKTVNEIPNKLLAYEDADKTENNAAGKAQNTTSGDVLDADHIKMNQRLAYLRRYILIVVDDNLPHATPPYASYDDGQHRYDIEGDDEISQKNFHLLTLFLTMMAAPPQNPPLTPTINVGG